MKKRILCFLLILAIFICIVPTVSAEISGDFEYRFINVTQAEITGYKGSATNIVIPSTIDGHQVASIGANAFKHFKKIESVEIPSGVISIGPCAFEHCYNLESITIPDSVCDIDTYAFRFCFNLKSVTIPQGVTTIQDGVFWDCSALTSVTIPDNVKYIDKGAFEGCSSLTSVTIPKNLEEVGPYAFGVCSALKDVYYNNTTTQFGKISIDWGNECFEKATAHCTDGAFIKNSSKFFKDVVRGRWYNEYIDYAFSNGFFTGVSGDTFEPNTNLTRAMFVTVLARMSGADIDNNVVCHFDDVRTGKWYTGAIKWASENGIVNGLSDTIFGFEKNITREQMCTMLVRFANCHGILLKRVNKMTDFADHNDISKYSVISVYACQQAGIVNGKGDNKFEPKGNATRAEASKILSLFHREYMK